MGETEAEFQAAVIDLARLSGWLVHHTRPARTADGWRTPIQGDKGFPDLVLVHERTGRQLLVELKSETGRLSEDQLRWGRALMAGCGPNNYRVWRPSDWDELARELRGR